MELLLNLAWMLLALPAYWLWRRQGNSQFMRGRGPMQALLALGCVLVLLFPVISASDDLHAMRAEMEDSSISKRTVRQASGEKHAHCLNHLQNSASIAASASPLYLAESGLLENSAGAVSALGPNASFHAGRAPPFFLS